MAVRSDNVIKYQVAVSYEIPSIGVLDDTGQFRYRGGVRNFVVRRETGKE